MSKWTEDYDYDDDEVVQIYSYQFIIQSAHKFCT